MVSFRAGYLGLIGLPNSGKSTLLNSLVQQKVSIVSPKPQTTRQRILGLCSFSSYQVILVDAPGLIKASSGLNAFLEKEAIHVIKESDALVAVLSLDVDSKQSLDEVVNLVHRSNKPWFVVVTKIDLVHLSHRKLQLVDDLKQNFPEVPVLTFSNTWTGSELDSFRADFFSTCHPMLPPMPCPLFDVDLVTPHSLRDLSAEIIREKCFLELSDELPYQIAVRIRTFSESEKFAKIEADIIVNKESQKAMVIGTKGSKIKRIGTLARKEIEDLLGHPCYLGLTVVVRENWMKHHLIMRELGYVNEKNS
ncbi:MAG: GTPase Era [Bdellovibrionaceae bacterium]|nr:GTPase Era [Pseudobdellovibrionaceae bacterium]MDW8189604.1 GTPase Era [Pseudobdellovibrionaceae bacterium]